MQIETAVRNLACDAAVNDVDGGAGANGTLEILAADGTTVLVTLDNDNPAFGNAGAVNPGEAVAAAIAAELAVAAGVATTAKQKDTDGNVLWTLSVGATGSGEDVEITNTNLAVGDSVEVTSYKVTMPAGSV